MSKTIADDHVSKAAVPLFPHPPDQPKAIFRLHKR